ncbi:hypothetical protein [Caballeronia sp. RCC_10]|uniref:hypothetical protein n=1 Tax=Caballeronia sp. RCC_10 TaxID=3239227 RepID=UPI003525F487
MELDSPAWFGKAFSELCRKQRSAATTITFVLGAGFSNSWDPRYPTGAALFNLAHDDWTAWSPILAEFLTMIGFPAERTTLDRELFLDIVYQVGMLRKYPPIRNRFVDDSCLDAIERELRYIVYRKFNDTAPPPKMLDGRFRLDTTGSPEKDAILSLFSVLMHPSCANAAHGPERALQVSFVTTNYDFVTEALVDSANPQERHASRRLYRGITPVSWCGEDALIAGHLRPSGNLLKVNGGFDLVMTHEGLQIDYRERDDEAVRRHPPQIMLPSRAQDYDQPYFQALFPKAVRLLQESRVVVLVGYGFPEEDALLRLLLRQFAEAPADGRQRVLHYVDLADERTQLVRARRAFAHLGHDGGLVVKPFEGSFGQWCKDVLKNLSI